MHWLLVVVGGALAFGISQVAQSDSDGEGRWSERWRWGADRPDFQPVTSAAYRNECGACHFAYQPGLLPARSWRAIMGDLANHFGENAELDETTRRRLEHYLVNQAADAVGYGRSPGLARSVAKEKPMRITETAYFRRKHHEVPTRLVRENADVGSFSNCSACHTQADKGMYDEHQVRIPGVGAWDD